MMKREFSTQLVTIFATVYKKLAQAVIFDVTSVVLLNVAMNAGNIEIKSKNIIQIPN